jgi:hypothetical protein
MTEKIDLPHIQGYVYLYLVTTSNCNLAIYKQSYYNLQLWFFTQQNQQTKNKSFVKGTYKFKKISFCLGYKANETTLMPKPPIPVRCYFQKKNNSGKNCIHFWWRRKLLLSTFSLSFLLLCSAKKTNSPFLVLFTS